MISVLGRVGQNTPLLVEKSVSVSAHSCGVFGT